MEPEKRLTMSEVLEMLMNESKKKMLSELETNPLFKNPYSSNENCREHQEVSDESSEVISEEKDHHQ